MSKEGLSSGYPDLIHI